MTRLQVFEKLTLIFQKNFDDTEIRLQEETTADDIEDWDSLEQINLVVAIQDEFKIKFNIEEVKSMKNVGEMVNLILSKMQR